jgi:hypothetical protein
MNLLNKNKNLPLHSQYEKSLVARIERLLVKSSSCTLKYLYSLNKGLLAQLVQSIPFTEELLVKSSSCTLKYLYSLNKGLLAQLVQSIPFTEELLVKSSSCH